MLPKERLLDIIQNFVCFNDSSGESGEDHRRVPPVFAVRKAIVRAEEAVNGDGKIGVFWHTQGSGKSLSMVFFAHLLQRYLESPTIVVITDRNDLDDQLFDTSRCARFLRQKAVQAESRRNLQELLEGRGERHHLHDHAEVLDGDEPLCDRSNVVVMVDEAHSRPVRPDRTDQRGRSCVGRRGPCRARHCRTRPISVSPNADLHG
ncbi:MAG: DEAD/DEAH box helicase family protein [Bifidobacterium pseudocatenulatum]